MVGVILLLGLFGCQKGELPASDDVDLIYDMRTADWPEGGLHEPYATRAEITLHIPLETSARRTRVVNHTPDVVTVLDDSQWKSNELLVIETLAEGEAHLEVISERTERSKGSVTFDVREPSSFRVSRGGALLTGGMDPLVETPVVRTGNTGYFLVELYDGSTPLGGTGTLRAEALDAGLTASIESVWVDERREWLAVKADAPGVYEVALYIESEVFATVMVESVDFSDIAEITLVSQEAGASEGDIIAVVAHAEDVWGRPVEGLQLVWERGEKRMDGRGNLYRYAYNPDVPYFVTAKLGSFYEEMTLHIDNDSELGLGLLDDPPRARSSCSHLPATPLAVWMLAGIGAGLRRRRR